MFLSALRCNTHRSARASVMALHCGSCKYKIDINEGIRLFLRKQMPAAGSQLASSLNRFPHHKEKSVGIFKPALISPPNGQVQEVLNGGAIGCPRCGLVRWKAG
mmetsp:Transcript_14204/g.21000  ORF Transcript_14204/g.21000 Transcript_14204/m.21000 type:complete len:104 (+) Transcript_14204:17-328(+)|eukprot:1771806-Amphidinium_carterae.1